MHGFRSMLTLFILLLLTVSPVGNAASEPLAGLLLTWERDPTSSMTIDWHFATGAGGVEGERSLPEPKLWYALAGSDDWTETKAVIDTASLPERAVYRAALSGLAPDSEYQFRVAGHDGTYKFRTMPETLTRPIIFAAGGDTMHEQPWFEQMNTLALSYDPDFIIWGGDLAYANGVEYARWHQWFDAVKNTLVAPDGRVVPVIFGIGNHEVIDHFWANHQGFEPTDEWRVRIAPFFYTLLAFPGHPGYATLDFGDYLSFIILDTDHTNPIEGEQTEWLARALAERRHIPNVIPVYHVPAYPSYRSFSDSRSQKVREHWLPLFEEHGIRVAYEHHDHTYKRTVPILEGEYHPRGIIYVGDGSWGVDPRPPRTPASEWYLAVSSGVRHAIIVALDHGQQHYLVVDSEGRVLDEFYVSGRQGVYIESPADGATVSPATPVRISLDPDIVPREVQVILDGEAIYHGPDVPAELPVSSTYPGDMTTLQLRVRVTDVDGIVREKVARFRVKRLTISMFDGIKGVSIPRLKGDVPLDPVAVFAPGETLAEAKVSLVPIVLGEAQGEHVLYRGQEIPARVLWETRDFDDGAYDVVFEVKTDQGGHFNYAQRVVVRNWNVVHDRLLPPTASGWFGSIDRLLTRDRSDGWLFLTDSPGDFFGDSDRLASDGRADEYLTWEAPHLYSFRFTLYTLEPLAPASFAVAVSKDNEVWNEVESQISVLEKSEGGWHKVEVAGENPFGDGVKYVRFTLKAGSDARGIQLGEADLVAVAQD